MGTPDSFKCECMNCGTINYSQTKLYANELNVFQPEDRIGYCSPDLKNCILELKEGCSSCGTFFRVLILDGVYKGLVVFKPTFKEKSWGEYESVS